MLDDRAPTGFQVDNIFKRKAKMSRKEQTSQYTGVTLRSQGNIIPGSRMQLQILWIIADPFLPSHIMSTQIGH